ncbi:tetratricopeptide repeat protein [Phenylobacterium sp.]|uniref:tetratricopeptide repeat protein n=1 Tax=Phenylobacterium sp. TaxID=1871053 RepID=UPI0026005D3B|nr:tetratricopeptide repeat protein [Phenylobacterium sp.]
MSALGLLGGSLPLLGLSLVLSIALAVHVVRTGRELFWLWIILIFQPLGGLVYFIAIVLPDLTRGPAAQRLERSARAALDPMREYREAKQACEETPTVRNQSRLAHAAAALGRHDEAERLYAEAAHGIHAEDPALLLGRANALLELDRADEALRVIELIPGGETADPLAPGAVLALARAHERLGDTAQADAAYAEAVQRMPGFEAQARYAAFMARNGRKAEAQAAVAEMDKRLTKLAPQFRKEGRHWRDLAAKEL